MDKEKLKQIVIKTQQGDPDGATELYLGCRDDLYYYIMKTVSDPHLAEDLLQDTFMEILETIGKLSAPEAFVVWSRQIAYHRCTAYFRKRHDLLADENEDGQTVFDTVAEDREEFIPDAALEKEDLKATIAKMIEELPQEQKSALLLRYFDELSVADIAKIQGVSEGTVKSRLNYGRKAIKESVEKYEKKNGIKLHSVAILPLILWFFREKAIAAGTSLTAKGAAAVATAAANAANGATGAAAVHTAVSAGAKQVAAEGAKQAVAAGAKQGAKGMAVKLIASVAATAVISGAGTAMVMKNADPKPEPTTPPSTTVQLEQPTVPDPVAPTQPAPQGPELPQPGTNWSGFGDYGSGSRWFDMQLTAISPTTVEGNLVITFGANKYHETGFSGDLKALEEQDKRENEVVYTITLDKPHLLSSTWDVTLESLDLTYNTQKKTFEMDHKYHVILQEAAYWNAQRQKLPTGTWMGMGNDDAYLDNNNQHRFDLQVDDLTTLEISGHLTVSFEGVTDHDTAFNGRARPRNGNGSYTYDIVLDTVRVVEGILDTTVDDLSIVYDPATQTFQFEGLQFYDGVLEKQ